MEVTTRPSRRADLETQEQSRHKSLTVFSGYVRTAWLFEDHACKDFA